MVISPRPFQRLESNAQYRAGLVSTLTPPGFLDFGIRMYILWNEFMALGPFPIFSPQNPTERRTCSKGTWCSWLSRSLSMSSEGLREGSGSIPDVSIFLHFCLVQSQLTGANLATQGKPPESSTFVLRFGSRAGIGRAGRSDRSHMSGQKPGVSTSVVVRRWQPRCLPAAETTISRQDCTEQRGTGPVTHVGRGKASNCPSQSV